MGDPSIRVAQVLLVNDIRVCESGSQSWQDIRDLGGSNVLDERVGGARSSGAGIADVAEVARIREVIGKGELESSCGKQGGSSGQVLVYGKLADAVPREEELGGVGQAEIPQRAIRSDRHA